MDKWPKRTRFTEYFIRENHLENSFKEWLFSKGMLFRAAEKWWDGDSDRKERHEGLDFCLYRDIGNRIIPLDELIRIPAMFGGKIARIFDDFIGKSITIRHRSADGGKILLSIYGHTEPIQGLSEGQAIVEGEAIAHLAVPRRSRSSLHPHLHVSLLEEGFIRAEMLDWSGIKDADLLDPLDVLDWPYHVVPHFPVESVPLTLRR